MTDLHIGAFVLAPLMAVAFGWGVAIWARHAGRSSGVDAGSALPR